MGHPGPPGTPGLPWSPALLGSLATLAPQPGAWSLGPEARGPRLQASNAALGRPWPKRDADASDTPCPPAGARLPGGGGLHHPEEGGLCCRERPSRRRQSGPLGRTRRVLRACCLKRGAVTPPCAMPTSAQSPFVSGHVQGPP